MWKWTRIYDDNMKLQGFENALQITPLKNF